MDSDPEPHSHSRSICILIKKVINERSYCYVNHLSSAIKRYDLSRIAIRSIAVNLSPNPFRHR